jgi:acyl-CoA reductase-like NAD-dependent aldehyde dehydrogenase
VNKAVESAQAAQKLWAKTPLWKRAEALHRFAGILKDQKNPIAECLVKEIAKPQKDAVTEVRFPLSCFLIIPALSSMRVCIAEEFAYYLPESPSLIQCTFA